jgi:hypothetical protein
MAGYEEVRQILGTPYRNLSDRQIESLMERYDVNAEDVENFLSTLGNIGRSVVNVLPAALPLVGTALGGPVGGMLGGVAGQALGSALGGGRTGAGPQQPALPAGAPSAAPAAAMPGGSPAAGQLLQTIFRPETLQALFAMLMGQAGRQNIPVGNTQVPPAAFTNLLGVLANQAAAEFALTSGHSVNGESLPRYLENYAGEAYVDPAVPEHRAAALFELLQESDGELEEYYPVGRSSFESTEHDEQLEALYDELDLNELYGEYQFS